MDEVVSRVEFDKTVAELRLALDHIKKQQIHLAGISTPLLFERQVKDCQNVATEALQGQRSLQTFVKDFLKTRYVQLVTYEQMIELYNLSGSSTKEIADLLHFEISHANRILSGERKKDDFETYYKISHYCSEKIKDVQTSPVSKA